MASLKIVASIIYTTVIILNVDASKLNIPRVLLPVFSDFSTKFTLEAIDGGCYKWTTTRSDIIKLTPIDPNEDLGCSSKAEVRAITKEDARNLAVVLAEDVLTAQILKCDVIVDVIHSLSLTTTTREIFMEEVPEAFQINAYDAQGNEFTTLEGVEFDWSIVSIGLNKDVTVLRYLPFKDSPYETPPHIEQLEEENKKGSIILLEGVKTGSARVSVRLPYLEYRHVMSIDAVLTVIANLLLTPAEVYVMIGDVVNFKLYYMNSGRLDEIILPDAQYYLESENQDIVHCVKKVNEATALKVGRTRIVLHNSNLNEDDPALKLPSTIINVVQPAYLVLSVLPYKNWAVLVGDQHEIFVEVFSSTDHKLHLGPGVEIHTQIGDGFHVEERSRNGSWITGWGVKESRALVQATLESIVHQKRGKFNLDTPLQSQAELYIYPRITISPSEVVLPWDPQVKPKYEIDLIAKGGDGRFLWTSSDHSVGVVTQTGHVRTVSYGFFDVSAAMMRNHHNRQIVKFSILPPVRLEIVEFVMEAETGAPIYLHIAMFAEKSTGENTTEKFIPFTQCQNLPFQIRQSDAKFVQNKSEIIPPVGISCANVAMVASEVGTSKVTITYYQDGLTLEDSATISAYYPLRLLYPDREIVLAVGSSLMMVFTGGPRPQIGRQSDHQRIVISENEAILQAEDVTDSHKTPDEDSTIVWVLCRKLGESYVKLMISNTPTVPNCKSQGSILVTKVICGKPRRVHLQPELKIPNAKSCPMDLSGDRIVVPSNQDLGLEVVVQDELGRVFLNASSLLFTWDIKPPGIKLRSKDGVIVKNETFGTVPVIIDNEQIVRATPEMGLVEVTATIVGYKMPILKYFQITPEWPEFLTGDERINDLPKITSTIGLFFVNNTEVTNNYTVIFNQAASKKVVTVLHGSGYNEFSLSSDDVAQVNYIESTRQLEITPIRSGEMTIQLTDLCLMAKPVHITVKVVSVGRIEIEMANKVEVNHCIQCVAKIYDETDQLLDMSEIAHIDLKHRFTKNIAHLGRMPRNEEDPWPLGELHFILTGVEVGDTQLMFSFINIEKEVLSLPADLQVFPPLKITPRNSTLLVGSTLQLTLKGGPQPESHLEFVTAETQTVDVTETGIVVGKALGSTKITARSVGVHVRTGDKVIYSEDTVEVQVIQMTGIKIMAPLIKFRVGGTVSAWVTGIPEQLSPIILASFEDQSIQYDWYVRENDVAAVNPTFAAVGILYRNYDRVIIRVTGLQAGKTKLGVNVTLSNIKLNKPATVFYSSVDLEVFETLALVHPLGAPGKSLLMSQHTTLQLRTNLDDCSKIEYSLPDINVVMGSSTSLKSADGESRSSIVSVSRTGLVESYDVIGYAMLLVTATDDLGLTQTLTYVIEVKPVHYMILSVIANWRIHLDSSLRVLPLGTEFELAANFYDNLGHKFNAGPHNVKIRSNRLDLVKIKQFSNNASIHVATKKSGHTVIKAWTEGTDNAVDYIRIHAEEVVKPVVEYLTSGDIMCLWSPVVTKHLQIGHWSSSDDSMITIDSTIDIAFVVGNREGTVMLTHPLHRNAPLRLQVLPVAEVALFDEPGVPFTNGPEGSYYRLGVVLRSRMGPADKQTNLIQGWHCDRTFSRYLVPTPFRCFIAFTNESASIDANSIFSLKSSFDPKIGQYNCKISSTGVNSSEVSTLMTNVSVWVITDEAEIESLPLELTFTPNVFAPPEVVIGESGVTEFDVVGLHHILQDVKVHAADSSIVYVNKGHFYDPTHKRFQVHLVDYHPKFAGLGETMGIVITSPVTAQTLRLMVKVSSKYIDDSCLANSPVYKFIQRYKHSLMIIISMLVIFCITCYVYSRYMQPVVMVNVHPSRSFIGSSTHLPMGSMAGIPGLRMSMADPRMSMVYGPSTTGQLGTARLSTARNRSVLMVNGQSNDSHVCTNRFNCTCCPSPQEPVYGDISSLSAQSPEMRRNRRFL